MSQFSLHEGKKRPASSYNKANLAAVNAAEVVSAGAADDTYPLTAYPTSDGHNEHPLAPRVRPPRPSTSKTVRVSRPSKPAYGYKGYKPVLNNYGAVSND